MKSVINKIIEISNYQFKCINFEEKEQQFWYCNVCGFHFIRKAIYFNKKNPNDFCKACNRLESIWQECERDFLSIMQGFMNEYNELYFAVQVEHPSLRGKRFTLKSDLGIYTSFSKGLPILILEVNENSHKYYINNQDNIRKNYYRKLEFYKIRGIPTIEVDYEFNSEKQYYRRLFSEENIRVILNKVSNLSKGQYKGLKIEELFPYKTLSMYK